jgi:hypothetical protein
MTLGALVAIICVIDGNIGGAVVALAIGGLFHAMFGGHDGNK